MNKLKIVTVPLAKLVNDAANARQHGLENRQAIRKSLLAHGQVEPLVVQASSMRVLGGNARLAEMRELGWTHAEIVKLDVDDQEAQQIAIRLNRTGELATWDETQLATLLRELQTGPEDGAGYDVTLLGFSEDELSKLFEPPEPAGGAPASTGGGGGPVTAEYVDLVVPLLVTDRAMAYDVLRAAKAHYGVENNGDALLAILRTWRERDGA